MEVALGSAVNTIFTSGSLANRVVLFVAGLVEDTGLTDADARHREKRRRSREIEAKEDSRARVMIIGKNEQEEEAKEADVDVAVGLRRCVGFAS